MIFLQPCLCFTNCLQLFIVPSLKSFFTNSSIIVNPSRVQLCSVSSIVCLYKIYENCTLLIVMIVTNSLQLFWIEHLIHHRFASSEATGTRLAPSTPFVLYYNKNVYLENKNSLNACVVEILDFYPKVSKNKKEDINTQK